MTHDPRPEVLIDALTLSRGLDSLAARIDADFAGREVTAVGVLTGAFVFMADLVRRLTVPLRVDFLRAASYGRGTSSTGEVRLDSDVTLDLSGRHVLLVEDILDTGMTTSRVMAHLANRGPQSLSLCVLLDKPSRRKVDVRADYVGFTVPDRFVVGYGLDCDGRYRELPYVGWIAPPGEPG